MDNVISLENRSENKGLLSSLLRLGVRDLIKKAIQIELVEFLSQYIDMINSEGRPLVVRKYKDDTYQRTLKTSLS
jgi:hypothetical protein